MGKRHVVLQVMAAATLLGCAHAGHDGPGVKAHQVECTTGSCTINIYVVNCNPGGVAKLAVLPAALAVDRETTLHWKIETSGYRFANNGIDFKADGAEFPPQAHGGPNQYVVRDKYTIRGRTFKYDINVQLRDGTACGSFDPTIRNN